jgi:hypothetical protein
MSRLCLARITGPTEDGVEVMESPSAEYASKGLALLATCRLAKRLTRMGWMRVYVPRYYKGLTDKFGGINAGGCCIKEVANNIGGNYARGLGCNHEESSVKTRQAHIAAAPS